MEKIFTINSVFSAFFYGSLFGIINGYITYYFLKKYINENSKKFFKVYVLTFIYKLLFLIISIWMLKYKKVIIIIIYAFFLIFFQVLFELRVKNGTR